MTVADVDGCRWRVVERRPTNHGFDLLLGRPAVSARGGASTILTPELVAYFETRRYPARGAVLPLSSSAIKRLRRTLGLDWYAEHARWWEERIIDLVDLTAAEFAARHGQELHTVEVNRIRMLGTRQSEAGWWRAPDVAEQILSDLPRSVVATSLGLSIGAIGRMRWVLRQEIAAGRLTLAGPLMAPA